MDLFSILVGAMPNMKLKEEVRWVKHQYSLHRGEAGVGTKGSFRGIVIMGKINEPKERAASGLGQSFFQLWRQ